MKKIKSLFFLVLIGLFTFTSCENEDTILDDQQQQNPTEDSSAIITALNKMAENFDGSGNIDPNNNPVGNIIFDFCFDFVYPLTLSYNNGSSVAVDDLDELVTVIINSTDQLFITGIAFPFDVETFDDSSNAIVVQTINDEADFLSLILSCDFDDDDNVNGNCQCSDEDYDPVCIEITDPNGTVFNITYPNECYAYCDGFDDDDFIDDCFDDDFYDDDFYCFDFLYPLDIILDNGTVVTITDDDDFENTMYNSFFYNFVYPFSVELEDENDTIVVINNQQDFEQLLADCFGNGGGFFDCDDCDDLPINPVCVQYTDNNGVVVTEVYPNLCIAECLGFTAADIVDCGNGNDPSNGCTQDEVIAELTSCNEWDFEIGNVEYYNVFNLNNNTVTVFNDNDNAVTTGTWVIITDPVTGASGIEITTQSGNFTNTWLFTGCDQPNGPIVISNLPNITDIESDCDGNGNGNGNGNGDGCTDDAIIEQLTICNEWDAEINNVEFYYVFNLNNNTVTVFNDNDNVVTTGTWAVITDPVSGDSALEITTQSGNFSNTWFFTGCDLPNGPNVISNQPFITDIESDCD
jgi:hypothetical protein